MVKVQVKDHSQRHPVYGSSVLHGTPCWAFLPVAVLSCMAIWLLFTIGKRHCRFLPLTRVEDAWQPASTVPSAHSPILPCAEAGRGGPKHAQSGWLCLCHVRKGQPSDNLVLQPTPHTPCVHDSVLPCVGCLPPWDSACLAPNGSSKPSSYLPFTELVKAAWDHTWEDTLKS